MSCLLYTFPLTSSWLQGQDKSIKTKLTSSLKILDQEKQPLVIIGDEKCGKTVLLFQTALSYASQDMAVTFISRQPLTRMPLSVHGMTRPDSALQMKMLTFMYMNSATEVIQYFSSIHTRSLLPEIIIIDDLDFYLGQLTDHGPEAGTAKLLALLLDAVDFIKSKNDSRNCLALLGCKGKFKFLPSVLKQFKYNMAKITVTSSQQRAYRLELITRSVSVHLDYTIEDTGVYLQEAEFIS